MALGRRGREDGHNQGIQRVWTPPEDDEIFQTLWAGAVVIKQDKCRRCGRG